MPTHRFTVSFEPYDRTVAPWPGHGFTSEDFIPLTVVNDGVVPADATITGVSVTVKFGRQSTGSSVLIWFGMANVYPGIGATAWSSNPPDAEGFPGHYTSPPVAVAHATFGNIATAPGFTATASGSVVDLIEPGTGTPGTNWASLTDVLTADWQAVAMFATDGAPEDPLNPEDFYIRLFLQEVVFNVTYTGGTPPNTTQPTNPVPCCPCDCTPTGPGGVGSGGPTDHPGNVPPAVGIEPVPQCVGGGEFPVTESLVDSEMYF